MKISEKLHTYMMIIIIIHLIRKVKCQYNISTDVEDSTTNFIGFDCGSTNVNITSISRVHVEECVEPDHLLNTTTTKIQLLQLNEFSKIHVIQCKVDLIRIAYFCGFMDKLSTVKNAIASYVTDMTREECDNVHETGYLKIGKDYIQNIRVNTTSSHSVLLAGGADYEAYCSGESFTDSVGTYNNVVVQATARVTLKEYYADIDLNNNKILLHSGMQCPLTDTTCFDIEGGHTFWNPIPQFEACSTDKYSIIYEGPATKISTNDETLYIVNYESTSFTLPIIGSSDTCFPKILRTQHPKLLIADEINHGLLFNKKRGISPTNIDLFTYVNSKFLHVDPNVRLQVNNLYKNLVMKRCELERQVLQTKLGLASINPEEFALRF